jgi:beta-glucosidase
VLLRNERVGDRPVLPVPGNESIALLGSLSDAVNLGDAGSSDVWDDACTTPLAGLRLAGFDVRHASGEDLDEAARVAAAADVAVVVVGFTRLDEGEFIGQAPTELYGLLPAADEPEVVARFAERKAGLPETRRPERLADRPPGLGGGGDRTSLRLKDSDVTLIRAVAAANPRCVVVLQAGSAVIIEEWVSTVPAVVQSWYAGCEAGTGLADVISGLVNPSGRLPFSVPAAEEHLPFFDRHATSIRYDRWHGWWHLEREGHVPAYPFGFGLSYTEFTLEDAQVVREPEDIVATGTIRNNGDRDGSDVVQVYAELPDPDAPRRLVGFARVNVPARDATAFSLRVPLARLQTRDTATHSWRPTGGEHVITVARHALDPQSSRWALDV